MKLLLWTHCCLFTNLLKDSFKQTDYAEVVFAHTIWIITVAYETKNQNLTQARQGPDN